MRARDASLAVRLEALLVADAALSGLLECSLEEVAPNLHQALLGTAWETRAGTLPVA